MKEITAFIGLGANLDNPLASIEKSLLLLQGTSGVKLVRVASVYLTEPVGCSDQNWFLNTVAEAATSLSAHELLRVLLGIENTLGRVREKRWGPRVVDLDLIMYGEENFQDDDLQVPHPRFMERAFVLEPLAELHPGLVLPGGRMIKEALAELKKTQAVKRLNNFTWRG